MNRQQRRRLARRGVHIRNVSIDDAHRAAPAKDPAADLRRLSLLAHIRARLTFPISIFRPFQRSPMLGGILGGFTVSADGRAYEAELFVPDETIAFVGYGKLDDYVLAKVDAAVEKTQAAIAAATQAVEEQRA